VLYYQHLIKIEKIVNVLYIHSDMKSKDAIEAKWKQFTEVGLAK